MIPEVAVVGATGWGTTLAMHIARHGRRVQLVTRSEAEASTLTALGHHPRLPDSKFPGSMSISNDSSELAIVAAFVFVVPAQTMRANVSGFAGSIGRESIVVHAAKGLERGTAKRMSEVVREELSNSHDGPIAVISGPNLAREVAAGLPSTTVVASEDDSAASFVQELLMAPAFRAYTSNDVIGVELGGSLKNIIALGAGLVDGFNLGDNAKAAYITRGLAEMTRLGISAGADPMTFQGLSGLGDLVATCYSRLSRNRMVGERLAAGESLEQILGSMNEVAEGVDTVPAALALATQQGVEMPITEQANAVLFEGRPPLEALRLLLEREPTAEFWTGSTR